jgi:hypothetical protein
MQILMTNGTEQPYISSGRGTDSTSEMSSNVLTVRAATNTISESNGDISSVSEVTTPSLERITDE